MGEPAGAGAQEIRELERLLDLLEEGLDRPAAAVQVGDAGRAPLQVAGQKNHLLLATLDFHPRGDAAHEVGVISHSGCRAQGDDFIAQDAAGHRRRLEDFKGHALCGVAQFSLAGVTQKTPRCRRSKRGAKSRQALSKTTTSPERTAAQSSRERLASLSRAGSMMAKRGRKLCRSSRR